MKKYLNDLSDFDLLVMPCNCMMEPISYRDRKLIKKIQGTEYYSYVIDSYKIYKGGEMKDGDIRIVPGFSLNADIMFVKFPFRTDDKSINLFMKTITNMFEIKRQNGYEKTLISKYDPFNYGYTFRESMKILLHRIKENKKDIECLTKK